MKRDCEVTLLTYDQILGKKKLKIFDKIDVSTSASSLASDSSVITDFAILLGGEFDFLNFNDSNLTEKTGSYFNESSYCYGGQKNKFGIIEGDGKWIWHKIDDWKIGIRPALTFSKNLFIPKKKIGMNF